MWKGVMEATANMEEWGDQCACTVFGWLLGNVMELIEVLEWWLELAMKMWKGVMEATANMEEWGDQCACTVFGWLLGNVMELIEVLEW
nr:hypothetical protein [Tanacetum cinerariifolium]